MSLEIITVDHPKAAVLRRRAYAVRTITPKVRDLVARMIETMREHHGLGLAAPQVGESLRLFVAEVEGRLVVLIDPEVLRQEGEEEGTEGCLSIPGVLVDGLPRAARVRLRGKNRRGRRVTIDAEGLLARVLQHEIDHLDGILVTDRVQDPERIRHVDAPPEEVAAV
ncbi:MAG: peptide deformylase [Armatimonadetes bacterium]|nr:peptide deformylase [Armatimonadota bacterium]